MADGRRSIKKNYGSCLRENTEEIVLLKSAFYFFRVYVVEFLAFHLKLSKIVVPIARW